MIDKRTVFVLGAGASCPYGFPTARELRDEIIENFEHRYERFFGRDSNNEIRVCTGFPSISAAGTFIRRFDDSGTESIDLFLSRHPESVLIGKLAILFSILGTEEGSCFGRRVQRPEHDWYFYLYNRLTRELVGENGHRRFGENSISFVTFNYDRSFEHFLFSSLLNSFEGAEQEAVREQVEAVPVVHVYGRIAPLPWQDGVKPAVLKYGVRLSRRNEDLLGMVDNLHVVHEQRQNPEIQRAREEISKAKQIFFLGFGYASENLEALGLPGMLRPDQRIYGTALGYTEREIRDVETFFTLGLEQVETHPSNKRDQVKIRNCDCVALLREFL